MRLSIVDELGVQRMLLVDDDVDGAKVYDLQVDLSEMPSGSYFLVFQTPNITRSVPFIIQQ